MDSTRDQLRGQPWSQDSGLCLRKWRLPSFCRRRSRDKRGPTDRNSSSCPRRCRIWKNLSRFSPIKKIKKKKNGEEEKKGRGHLVIRTPMSKWFGWSVSSGFNLSAHAAKLANVSSALGLMDKSIYGKTILKWIGTILWSRVYGRIFVSRFLTLSLRGRQRKNQIFQQPKVQQLYTLPIIKLL